MSVWKVVDTINLPFAFPLNIKSSTLSNFTSCLICLKEDEIKQCVLLVCTHRFCIDCANMIKICAICRGDTIPSVEERITLQ